MTWQRIPLATANGLGHYAEDWDRLNLHLTGGHPMLSALFVRNLLRKFGNGQQHLLVSRRHDEFIAMCVLEPRNAIIWRSFLPSQTQLGPTLISPGETLQGIFSALPWTVQAVELLCHDHRLCAGLLPGARGPLLMPHAVTIDVDITRSFNAYWDERPKKLQKNIRRYQNRAQSLGISLRLGVLQGEAEVLEGVKRYADLEGKGWKGNEGTALASLPEQMRFYLELMRQFGAQEQSRVFELWGNSQLLASRLAVASASTLLMLKTTFDETQRELAPGRLLLHQTLAHLFQARPGTTVAFCTNADRDQLDWADRQRTIQHVTVFRSTLGRWGLQAASAARRLSRGNAQPVDGSRLTSEVSIFDRVALLPTDALALLTRCAAHDISLGPQWLRNFEHTVMAEIDGTRLLCLRRGGQIRAVLSMNLNSKLARIGGTIGALANHYTTLWGPALEDGVTGIDLAPLFVALRRKHGRLPVLQFSPMDTASPGFAVLGEGLRAAGYRVEDYLAHGNWYLPVRGDWEHYLASLTSKMRSNIRRLGKQLDALGARTEVVSAPDEVDRAMDAYEAVYAKSWKPAEPAVGFMRGLAHTCAEAGWLRLGLVWLHDEPVAAQFWIVSNGRAAIYKVAHDEQHKDLSPGTVLTAQMMRMAIETDQVNEVDYLVGDDDYKRLWMTHRRERRGLVAFDLATPIGIARAAKSASGAWLLKRRSSGQQVRQRVSVPNVVAALHVQVASSVADLSPSAIELLNKAERVHGACAGAAWYRNLCDEVPDLGQRAQFAVLSRDEQPIAVLPLLSKSSGWPATKRFSGLANYYTPLYTPAFDDTLTEEELASLLRNLQALLGKTPEIRFDPMDPQSREYALLHAALRRAGWVTSQFFCFGNWTHRPQGSFDDYMAQRPGALRTSHKRMPKRFAAAGGTLEIVSGGERLPAALAAYQRVYAASWKKPEPYPGFMPGLITTCAQRGWLRLGIAWLGGQPIATQLWIVAHGRAEIYKLAYDEAFKSHAAGTVLTAHLMRHAIDEDRVREVDYLIGDDEYKASWMDRRQERWGLIGYNPWTLRGMAGSVATVGRELIAPLRTRIAQSRD